MLVLASKHNLSTNLQIRLGSIVFIHYSVHRVHCCDVNDIFDIDVFVDMTSVFFILKKGSDG